MFHLFHKYKWERIPNGMRAWSQTRQDFVVQYAQEGICQKCGYRKMEKL